MEWIDRAECLQLLAGDEVGRLAIGGAVSPLIIPVNYVLDGEAIVMATNPGTKLDAAGRGRACFEIDAFDRATRTGWSVIVQGPLEEVTPYDHTTLERVRSLPLLPWAGEKDHWLRLVASHVSGRRIVRD